MSDNATTDNDEQTTETTTYAVYGWAELAPSGTIEVPASKPIDDVSLEEKTEALRQDLLSMGFSREQIQKMHLDPDEVVKKHP